MHYVIRVRQVFPRPAHSNVGFCTSYGGLRKSLDIYELLVVFNDATNVELGSEYPISNLFFYECYE